VDPCSIIFIFRADFGKLGRGGSQNSKLPKVVEKLEGIEIKRVYCGSQFSVALSAGGEVFTWGRGDDFRLGNGSEEHVRYPRKVEAMSGKVVTQLAVSQFFCLALTEDSQVYGWGRSDASGCLGEVTGSFLPQPALIHSLKGRSIVGMAAGPLQVNTIYKYD